MACAYPTEDIPTLEFRLLGGFDLRLAGVPVPPLASARAESLLAYLLLHPGAPQPRQHLAFLLWPDSTEAQARTNLRHLLHTLRRALPDVDRFLDASPRALRWRADAPFWLDVAAFEAAVAAAERGSAAEESALRETAALYTGDLLEGRYDEWLLGERERLRQRALAALERLVALLEARGDAAQAIPFAERLLRHDPLREETSRRLMRLHDANGDRARALRVYHACAATLERELGVEPSAATRAAYESLLPAAEDAPVVDRPTGHAGGPPFVGRAPERTRLTTLWRAAEGGRAQLVLVTGEPGIGKTRLVEELRAWCAHRGAATAVARAYPAEGALAYGPVVEWLRADGLEARLRRLDRARLGELARLLPELRAEAPDPDRLEPIPEGDQRQRLFDAVARALLPSGGSLLLVADDLHWSDQETLRFLHYLLRVEPGARLLVAATARREETDHGHPLTELLAGLHALERVTEIPLERLNREETSALAERIAGRPLAPPDANRLYGETEGNPLFVVETLRAGWPVGSGEGGWLSPRVQTAIESRLAQLSTPARDLVGVAATIGRAFTTDALALASEADPDAIVGTLDELWRRRIVREQGADAYDFGHDKIREVAYLALSPPRRRRLHLRVAQALERLPADDPAAPCGQIAAHYEQAGALVQAVAWYGRAAEAAQHVFANAEAVRLLDRALDLLGALPATAGRRERELALLAALLAPLGSVEGYVSARLAEAQRRALDLADGLGVEPAPPLLRSLAIASLSHGDFARARRFADRLHARGERDADDVLRVEGDYVLGIAAFWQGEFAIARRHFEAAVDRYRPDARHAHLLRYGLDPKVVCLSRLGNTLWFLGHPAAAARARDAALALADEIAHPFSRVTALWFSALLAVETADEARLRADAAMLASAPAQHETRPTRVATPALLGYVDVLDGRAGAGIARIRRVLDDSGGAEHAPGMQASIVRLLLAAHAATGDARAGLAAAERALGMGGARAWEAETRRLRAEFLAALGAPRQDVEAELERALAVARRQAARALELRVASSLLRHRREWGDARGAERARALLAEIGAGEGYPAVKT